MIDSFTTTKLLTQIPSSRASPPRSPMKPQIYTLSVQRQETSGRGRWREIASWTVTTTETDMEGPLNCGLRSNYRVIIHPEPKSTAVNTSKQLQEAIANAPQTPSV